MAKYGVSAAGMRWEDGGDAMIDAVRTGAAAALILDRPFLLAKTVDMCEVQVRSAAVSVAPQTEN